MKIYVCGPTVYSKVHIGNMRPIVSYDIYIRALRSLGTPVTFIHNITDVDDKIIAKAQEQKTTEQAIADEFANYYFDMLNKLNVVRPTHTPSVIENIDKIIEFIQKLVDNNNAYVVDGDVYFSIDSFKNYGSISGQKQDELLNDNFSGKKNPSDFALWKKTKVGILFDSPWGKGRPGWHTECCAFIEQHLQGESLDVHGGGIDLIFPHHENENAQYEALYGNPLAKNWTHVGHLFYKSEKMSKSIGNLITVDDFINEYGVDTLRMLFMMSNVTSPIDIHAESIANAKELTEKYKKAYVQTQMFATEKANMKLVDSIAMEITKWNFSEAMKMINDEIKNYNKSAVKDKTIYELMNLIGFSFTQEKVSDEDRQLYKRWEELKENKDFKNADILRNELIKKFIV